MIKVAFRTPHGTYLSAQPNGKVEGNRTVVRPWELWEVVPVSETHAAFKSAHGKFLCAEEGGGRELVANRSGISEWETFGYWQRDGLGSLQATHGLWVRVGDAEEGFRVDVTGPRDAETGEPIAGGTPLAWETFTQEFHEVPDVPDVPVGQHPDPVVGRIRVHGNGDYFKDDNGAKVFVIAHMGDLVARWMYARNDDDRAKILGDLNDAAAAGYQIIRCWWHLDVNHWPWNEGGDPPYPGVSAFVTPDFEAKGVDLVNEVAKRGMRITMGPGGINRLNNSQEREMFHTFRRIIDGAGHEKFAWIEGVNEPSSTHATSDNDGDNSPENLRELVRIAQEGTDILWHLGYWNNNDYRDAGRYCVPGMSYNYNHGWRGGNVFNKIDRRGTWCRIFKNEGVGGDWRGRLTIGGEEVGWPTDGQPLRYVSATENRHEMNSAEALTLIAAGHLVRGMHAHMSGTGVQRFQPFTESVAWRNIPWLARQLPQDVATFDLFHGGMNPNVGLVMKAATNGAGVLARADQAISGDGRFVAVIYNQRANQDQSFLFFRNATFKVLDTENMTSHEVTVRAGESLNIGMFWGRVLIGQAS